MKTLGSSVLFFKPQWEFDKIKSGREEIKTMHETDGLQLN